MNSKTVTSSPAEIFFNQAGVFLVDKPSGPTSHDVVAWARRLIGTKKIGHTGTLDPLASGLLIILVGRKFTRLQAEFLKQDKTYLVGGQLGLVSDSYDVMGKISQFSSPSRKITAKELTDALPKFVGRLKQTVPAFSAVKLKGKKLYQLARKGQIASGDLPQKEIEIYAIKLLSFEYPNFVLEVSCSSGTYIRSLIHDLGQELNVGAVVSSLRRLKIGQYSVSQAQLCPYFTRR